MCLAEDHPTTMAMRKRGIRKIQVSEESFLGSLLALGIGTAVSFATTIFSLYFPHMLTPQAAAEVYLPAFYSYDPLTSHFDNSVWTYGTDYVLAVFMALLAYVVLATPSVATGLKKQAAALLVCYATSVLAGGLAHQHYTTLEGRNSVGFRSLWTLCVGTVTLASVFMGGSGSEVARHYGGPFIPHWFWVGYGGFTTAVCIGGFVSYQRPACDIFIVGITQFVPSFYIMLLVFWKLPGYVPDLFRHMAFWAFVLNAPLLPMYAILIYYTDWSLASVNTLLHTWLLVTWGMQGLSLQSFTRYVTHPNLAMRID